MAKKENIDRRFTQDVHIRLTEAEATRLQRKADELGTTLSKAGRMLMFKRSEASSAFSEKDRRAALEKKVAALKATFKKVNTDVSRFVAGYERALLLRNRSGEPAVNTDQTIRTAESIIYNQMKIQDGLNEVIRHFGGTEVHVSAKPAAGTAVGDYMLGRRAESAGTPGRKEDNNEEIPFEFTRMANISILGTIVAEPETFQNGKYDMIRIVIQVEEKAGGAPRFYRVDCTDFKSRYQKILEYLKPDRRVLVAGDLRFAVGSFNGVQSDSSASVIISTLTLV